MRYFRLSEIFSFLNGEGISYETNAQEDCWLYGFQSIYEVRPGTVSWIKSSKPDWSQIAAGVIVCSKDVSSGIPESVVAIRVDNPRYVFVRLLGEFAARNESAGVAETAVIGNNCSLGSRISIGHYAVLGDNVRIGNNTIIKAHVTIYDNTIIGENCIIHSGSVIGADGFGYERNENGQLLKFPHIGGVVIGNDVEIGANTCIDRGTLGNTIIKDGVKIDNLCHIAHNVIVGENTTIIALSMIAGSTIIESDSYIAPGSMIKQGLVIGRNACVGMGAVVLRNVAADDTVTGVPARTLSKRTGTKES